jgi:hypothetical protein
VAGARTCVISFKKGKLRQTDVDNLQHQHFPTDST